MERVDVAGYSGCRWLPNSGDGSGRRKGGGGRSKALMSSAPPLFGREVPGVPLYRGTAGKFVGVTFKIDSAGNAFCVCV